MPDNRPLDMPFPLNGLDLDSSLDRQTPGTTTTGQNVRAFEPLTQRGRGGARPGLSPYLPQLPGGSSLVQLLDIIVDPTVDALVDNFDPPDSDNPVDDPSSDGSGDPFDGSGGNAGRNPGRRIRTGGSGRQGNRNRSSASRIRLVQSIFASGEGAAPISAAFPNPVTAGHLLVVAVNLENDDFANHPYPVSLSDSLGNSIAQIDSYQVLPRGSAPEGNASEYAVGLFWGVLANGGADTLTMTGPGNIGDVPSFLAYEFSGNSASPLGGQFAVANLSATSNFSAGPATNSQSSQLAFIAARCISGTFPVINGWTGAQGGAVLRAYQTSAGPSPTSLTATLSQASVYAAVLATFKHS